MKRNVDTHTRAPHGFPRGVAQPLSFLKRLNQRLKQLKRLKRLKRLNLLMKHETAATHSFRHSVCENAGFWGCRCLPQLNFHSLFKDP